MEQKQLIGGEFLAPYFDNVVTESKKWKHSFPTS